MNLAELGLKIITGLGLLAMFYRLYLAFTVGRENKLESKESGKVAQDEGKVAQDEKTDKSDVDAFNDAVSKFESDNK